MFSPGCLCCLTENFHLKKYYGKILSSCIRILVTKQECSGPNESLGKMHKLWHNVINQCKTICGLSIAKRPSLNLSLRQPINGSNDESNYWWQQILSRQFIKMSVNRASMAFDLERLTFEKWFAYYCVVLATGPGNPAVVQFLPGVSFHFVSVQFISFRFGSVPDPARNPTRFVLVGLLPGPDVEPWVFGLVGTGPRFKLCSSYTFGSY